MVVIYTLVTGPTLPWVATRLGVAQRDHPRDLEVEAAPLERVAADLLQVKVTSRSLMHGVEVGELRLPVGASVSLVVRDGRDAGAGASHGAAPRRRRARGDAAAAARGDRGAAAGGVDRAAGSRTGSTGPSSLRRSGLSRSTSPAGRPTRRRFTTMKLFTLASLWKLLPTTTSTPGPRLSSTCLTGAPAPSCLATSRAAASWRCVVHTWARFTTVPDGALPTSPLRKPRLCSLPRVLPARPDRVPAL